MNPWTKLEVRTPQAVSNAVAFADQGRVYFVNTTNVYAAPIEPDGRLGAFKTVGTINVSMAFEGGCVANNTVYLYGGLTAPARVWASKIGPDGTLGVFKNVNQFQAGFATAISLLAVGDWVYLLSSANGGGPLLTEVRAWRASDPTQFRKLISMPEPRVYTQPVYAAGYIFIFGGANAAFADTNTIYASRVEQDGTIGPWKTAGTLRNTTSRVAVVVHKDRIYVVGGRQGVNSTDALYSFQVLPEGQLGPQVVEDRMPMAIRSHYQQTFVAGNRLYVCGGFTTLAVADIWTVRLE